MGSAALISSAIALILLVIVAYFLVGTTLTTAEIVGSALDDKVQIQEIRMKTSIDITDLNMGAGDSVLNLLIENTGDEIISDFTHFDVYIVSNSSPYEPEYIPKWEKEGISPDLIHAGQLDPGEVMNISVETTSRPLWVQVTTANGVSTSRYV